MIIEIVLVLILVLIASTVIRFEHHAKTLKVVFLIIIGFLLYLAFVSMLSSTSAIDFSSPKGAFNTATLYVGYLGKTVVGLWDVGKTTAGATGNAIQHDNNTEQRNSRRGR